MDLYLKGNVIDRMMTFGLINHGTIAGKVQSIQIMLIRKHIVFINQGSLAERKLFIKNNANIGIIFG
jgi:hypothetical protein